MYKFGDLLNRESKERLATMEPVQETVSSREKILKAIDETPGLTHRQLIYRTGLPDGTVGSSLARAISSDRHELIRLKQDGAYRYYRSNYIIPQEHAKAVEPQTEPVHKSKRPFVHAKERILLSLEAKPGQTSTQLKKNLQLKDNTVDTTLMRMVKNDASLTKKKSRNSRAYQYYIATPEQIAAVEHPVVEVIERIKPEIVEKIVEKVVEIEKIVEVERIVEAPLQAEQLEELAKEYVWQTGAQSAQLKGFIDWYEKIQE